MIIITPYAEKWFNKLFYALDIRQFERLVESKLLIDLRRCAIEFDPDKVNREQHQKALGLAEPNPFLFEKEPTLNMYQAWCLNELFGDLTPNQRESLVYSGLLTDIWRCATEFGLMKIDRGQYQRVLGISQKNKKLDSKGERR